MREFSLFLYVHCCFYLSEDISVFAYYSTFADDIMHLKAAFATCFQNDQHNVHV